MEVNRPVGCARFGAGGVATSSSPARWGFGESEVSLNGDATAIPLRVIERRYVLLARKGSMPEARYGRGDATGGGTLPWPSCVYYTHILRIAEFINGGEFETGRS